MCRVSIIRISLNVSPSSEPQSTTASPTANYRFYFGTKLCCLLRSSLRHLSVFLSYVHQLDSRQVVRPRYCLPDR